MPVYNEVGTVRQAVDEVLSADIGTEIELVIVDDGSTDGTLEILDSTHWPPHVRVLKHEHNQGKGAAVRTALEAARGEFSAIFDADLEYDPADLANLMPPLLSGK